MNEYSMPTSPTGTCRSNSCSSRATANGFCDRHQDSKNDYKRLYDRYRADDPIRALYRTTRWKNVRLGVLRRDILCQACGPKAAVVVVPIVSARIVVATFGIDEFYNPERLQGLCTSCHARKTAQESNWAGRKGPKITDPVPGGGPTATFDPHPRGSGSLDLSG